MFKQERDVARERVRALIGEREAQAHVSWTGGAVGAEEEEEKEEDNGLGSVRAREGDVGVVPPEPVVSSRDSTPSSTTAVVVSDPEDDSNLYSLACPSPTYMPLVIDTTPRTFKASPSPPPPRSRSADAILYTSSNSSTTKKRDLTAFDVTITENPTGERRIQVEPAKKRRRKASPSKASDSGSSSSSLTAVGDATLVQEVAGTCIPGVLAKDDVEVEEVVVYDLTNKPKAAAEPLARSDSPPPPPKHASPKIDLTHIDLMYVPTNGTLVCRACLYVIFPIPV